MNKTKFLKENLELLIQMYDKFNNVIAHAAKGVCEEKGIEYDEGMRVRASEIINSYLRNPDAKSLQVEDRSSAKILLFDIETAPMEALIFSRFQDSVGLHQLQSDWFMFSWSAKWLFDPKVMSDVLTPDEAKSKNDKRITQSLWELINEADIIIAHNGKRFDEKRMNTRFFKYNLNPPSSYIMIDTLVHMKRKFQFTSNKLDWVAHDFLGLEGKIKTDFSLWEDCYNGDADALERMRKYNDQDVLVLEELYLKLRPWIQPHPNVGLYIDTQVHSCPACGSENVEEDGEYCTYATAYKQYRCSDCGTISRSRSAITTTERKKVILYSIPTR